jgi:hypothetical protein
MLLRRKVARAEKLADQNLQVERVGKRLATTSSTSATAT